ncbi:MAG: transpeptidase family protein [Acidobacteria bacterium]|nr:transpeptidase family protein [Acidobacteriota bacterium]
MARERRAFVLLGGVVLWIAVLAARLVDLQIVRRAEFEARARKQHERTVELPARRGGIEDREGRPLAVTATVDSVFAIPSEIADVTATSAKLAEILGMPAREIERRLNGSERDFAWIARRVDDDVARRLRQRSIPGVRTIKEFTRRYPQGSLASSILGYVGADNQGLGGLEHRVDKEIGGRPARVTLLRDAAQRSYAATTERGSRAAFSGGVEGASLRLTIDSAIQHVVERELLAAVETYRARSASAVVMDPETGAVLALASAPTFDPGRYTESSTEARRCRPVADVYEPGSTFKIITAAAGLETGTVDAGDAIDCGGGTLTIGSTTIHEHGRNRWGVLSFTDVLAHSSNIGIAHVGLGVGRGPFYAMVRAFGFGERTGIEVPGETPGLLREPRTWSALTLPTMSFGQEIGVTVLQMARAYAAIANGGRLPVPHLVAEVRRPSGREDRVPGEPLPRVISEATAAHLRGFLSSVVDAGTGKLAVIPGYTVAGKTGTAQKAVPGGYSRDRYVASFIGFAPVEAPRVVIAVVVDEPRGKIYGGDVAAPVFSAIGTDTLRLLRVPSRPDPTSLRPSILVADLESGAARATAGSVLGGGLLPASLHLGEPAPAPGSAGDLDADIAALVEDGLVVPDLSGLPASDAVRALSKRGLSAGLAGRGFVVAQEPAAGDRVPVGTRVKLTLSLAPPPQSAAATVSTADAGAVP